MEAPRRVYVVGSATNTTNVDLARSWQAAGVEAALVTSLDTLPPDAVMLGRLDVLPTLDGVEPGLLALFLLGRRGVRVLNRAESLLAVHDKLRTSRVLAVADLPQPRTAGWRGEHGLPLEPPFVLKPRFGSWGRDVFRCDDRGAVEAALEVARRRPWFRRHGAMLQELVPPLGYDLRLIVAGGRVVGAGRRVAAEGEWRTNISLGGTLSPVDPLADARALAVAAGTAVGADLVGVDLLPLAGGGHVVIELNGAVEFDERYSVTKRGIFAETAAALGIWPSREEWTSAHRRPELVSPS